MHFVSMGNFIFMLIFWLGSYLVTIWLMSRLFPATPVTQAKKPLKSESLLEKSSASSPSAGSGTVSSSRAARGEMSPSSIDTFAYDRDPACAYANKTIKKPYDGGHYAP